MKRLGICLATAVALAATSAAGPAQALPAAVCDTTTPLTLLTFNDFHGRLATSSPNTAAFVGTIEEQRAAAGEDHTLLISGGDNVGASLFTSFAQNDEPTLELLRTMDVTASAAGNHEFDQGWPDLRDRIAPGVNFPYLAANVLDASGKPVLPASTVVTKGGLRIGIVGGVTQDLPSLVSPAGLTGLTVTDLVPAVNKVIGELKDGNTANGEADVIVVTVHEGAPDGTKTLAQNVGLSPAFAAIANDLDPRAQVVVNAHTHQAYTFDAPNGAGLRPILQAGNYASNVGRVQLKLDANTGATCSYSSAVLPITTTPLSQLLTTYPRVAQVKTIVDDAITKATQIGQQVIGTATAPITRALVTNPDGSITDDRARESTLSNMVAQMFADEVGKGDPNVIGMQNPGGNRQDFDAGPITYAEAAAILPFANSLMTTQLTGAQVKTVLEQQWQRDKDGKVPTRPYLQLGLSKNVTYTYDASRPEGDRITSISVNRQPINPSTLYTIVSGSFLISGGDNFREIAKGVNTRDAGRADLEAWVGWIKQQQTLSPSYAKHAVSVHPLPTTLKRGTTVRFEVGVPQDTLALDTLDFKTNGLANDNLIAFVRAKKRAGSAQVAVGAGDVRDGQTTVSVRIPKRVQPGTATLVLRVYDSRTVVRIPVTIR